MMPRGGGQARAESVATLRKMAHEMATSEEMGDLISNAKVEANSSWDQANVDVIEHKWLRSTSIPVDLVVQSSLAASRCEQVWREQRKQNDWVSVSPLLKEVISLTQEKATILSEVLNLDLYGALLDGYETGLRTNFVESIFSNLTEFLPNFVNEVIEQQPDVRRLTGDYSDAQQMDLAKELMKPLGFNFVRGRIDTSAHPFTAGELWDTRITTRFGADDFLESMYAVLHETGHALYQQGLPEEQADQPVGGSLGMMIHESQSLFMEQQVCRSDGYLRFALPTITRCLNIEDHDTRFAYDNVVANVRHVEKGKIRVEADECTYPLHVILRYRIEKAFLTGELSVDDIPDAWTELMDEYFGLDLTGDFTDGCMQDIHWFMGAIGYFPCYTLGALAAAQFFQTFAQTRADTDTDFSNGHFNSVLDWLRENIHGQGRLTTGFERIYEVTGADLTPAPFVTHVKRRYMPAN